MLESFSFFHITWTLEPVYHNKIAPLAISCTQNVKFPKLLALCLRTHIVGKPKCDHKFRLSF